MVREIKGDNKDIVLKLLNSDELQKLFFELKDKVQMRILNAAFRKSGKPILDTAKTNFNAIKKDKSKTNYSALSESFKMKPMKKEVGLIVGMQHREGYKYRFINFGTKERFTRRKFSRKGHSTGSLQPSQFFTKAVESNYENSMKMLAENIQKGLENTIKRYEKRKK